ncbi:CBS domain-containing protein [Ramlibacter humi]|uniref:CBS domain-containing protein n=1 Tax=Ramlibacter humi TaxID=2530451 RepID=A0A4Z0CDV6_9BURK|nr:CBS domain-containing protein [Ramlibacter humi]TFZ08525.1 CBS domain-containing protein [Ramlibacter humi]
MDERKVSQSLAHKPVLHVAPETSVREAARLMTGANSGSVLVMSPPDRLLGILTERDLMTRVLARSVDPDRTAVRDVMTPQPICVPPETPVSEAVLIMLERGFRHLPVVRGGKVLGVFSARDALPREVGAAMGMAEFNEQVNDAEGG